MKFNMFSFVLGVAGGAALASWWIKQQSSSVSGLPPAPVPPKMR